MSAERIEMIRERLQAGLSPDSLEIIDDSHKHAGHSGAEGKGHFTVILSCTGFVGKTLIQRHRMVYEAMGDLMETEVHALSIQANTP